MMLRTMKLLRLRPRSSVLCLLASNRGQHSVPKSPVTSASPDDRLSEEEAKIAFSSSPPVLYLSKHGVLIDTAATKPSGPKTKTSDDDQEKYPSKLTDNEQQQLQHILKAFKKSKTFESLAKSLSSSDKSHPQPSLDFGAEPGGKVKQVGDEEFIEQNQSKAESQNQAQVVRLVENKDDQQALQWQDIKVDWRQLPNYCLMLSKSRLTMLVCITSAAGYGLASSAYMVFDPSVLVISTVGVGLTSAAANSINQMLEVPFDSQMNRTKNRVLVKGLLAPHHAAIFAATSGILGAVLLWNLVNPTASVLAMTNLFLYTSVYTPMKRVSILNTWVGSVVGAIPPIIGWASVTGSLDLGCLVLGGILYTWQFPHFNSLSWNLRPDYSRAGYRMMSVTEPDLCKRVALRHSVGCLLVCSVAAPLFEVTTPAFALDSLPLNLYLVYLSWKFNQKADSSSSRKLFRYTLLHLPLLMILMFVSRKRRGDVA